MSDLVVLCYHAVSDSWKANLAVTPPQLREQLRTLVTRGYRGATLSDALAGGLTSPTLVVTFDDAFGSVGALAAPILAELQLPGTVYAVSDFSSSGDRLAWPGIDSWQDTSDAGELEGMGWKQLGELADAGWEVGSHTCSHPHLTRLDDGELARELRDSRKACEQALQRPCRSVAYPYGDADERVRAAARAAGYDYGAALRSIPEPAVPMNWPRVGIYRRDTSRRFALKVSSGVRRLQYARGRAQAAASAVRAPRR